MVLQEITHSIIRTGFAFILLLVLTRIMGRNTISQATFFDFVVGITLGSIGANLTLSATNSIYSIITALITLTILDVFTDFFHIKSIKFSKLVESEPIIVINNGEINFQNMKRARFNLEDLTKALRQKNIFNIEDVEFALLENDGGLSVLSKSQKQPLTPFDLNLSTPYKGLTRDLIIDGKILEQNLKEAHFSKDWLLTKLNLQNIQDVSEVFYAGLDTSGKLFVSKKNKANENQESYGIE